MLLPNRGELEALVCSGCYSRKRKTWQQWSGESRVPMRLGTRGGWHVEIFLVRCFLEMRFTSAMGAPTVDNWWKFMGVRFPNHNQVVINYAVFWRVYFLTGNIVPSLFPWQHGPFSTPVVSNSRSSSARFGRGVQSALGWVFSFFAFSQVKSCFWVVWKDHRIS